MSRPNKLIYFYFTNKCNSHCKTCGIWKTKRCGLEELNVDSAIKAISEYPYADFVFGGGEFTLYSQRRKLLEYCDKNNINYTVLSNCISLDRLVELVLDFKIKNLTISCDGIDHDRIRGSQGNLDNIKTFIDKYGYRIENLKLSYTLSKYNQLNIDADMKLFKELGFEKIYLCVAQDVEILNAGDSEVGPFKKHIEYLYNMYGDMLYDKDLQYLEDILYGEMRNCDSTTSVHTIYSNGDVVKCQSYLSNESIGNIKDKSLKEILDNDYGVKDCPYRKVCKLECQRRYDYEDRV